MIAVSLGNPRTVLEPEGNKYIYEKNAKSIYTRDTNTVRILLAAIEGNMRMK